MNRLCQLVLLGALWLSGAVMAAEVSNIYEAEVAVSDQQTVSRQQAMRTGLAEVLVRVTGNGAVAQDPAFADLLDGAARYVQQYRYQAAPGSAASLLLWISFDAKAVNQALRARGQPVWGSARPQLLVWMAVEGGDGRQLVGAADSAGYRGLETAARRRGVPVRLPLLDLEEQRSVTASDIWGGFHDRVMAASSRYQAQAVLIGRLGQDRQGFWSARWTLRIGSEALSWDSRGTGLDEVLGKGIDGSADALAQRFAQTVTAETSGALAITVTDIDSLADHARVLSYLRGLGGVTAVQVDRVEPHAVRYLLTVQADTATVLRTIGLGSTLAAAGGPDSQPGYPPSQLHYRLRP